MRKFNYPNEKGMIYQVSSSLDIDYLRIVLDHKNEDFVLVQSHMEGLTEQLGKRFLLLDERNLCKPEMDRIFSLLNKFDSTVFLYMPENFHGHNAAKIDLSSEYEVPFDVLVEANVRKAFRKSIFFNSETGNWSLTRSKFQFPHDSLNMEAEYLLSINSDRNILTCYDKVTGLKILRIDCFLSAL